MNDQGIALRAALLDSARADAPSAASRSRIAMGIGLSAWSPAPSQPPRMGAGALSSPLRWVGLAVIVASTFGVTAHLLRPAPIAALSIAPSPLPSAQPLPQAAPVLALPIPDRTETALVRPAPHRMRPPRPVTTELSLIEDAHHALEGGRPTVALAALDQHDRQYRDGALQPESMALRAEALMQASQTDVGARLAQRFLAEYPESPLAGRVESLLKNK
jgi:hypothetical protein